MIPSHRILLLFPITLIMLLTGCITNPYLAPSDVAAPPPAATILSDGLAYQVLRSGSGSEHPALNSTITVNYTGWTTDGKKFDSTINPDGSTSPATFPLNKLIQGWQEVLPLMVKGEKIRVWIPGRLAYDNRNRPDAPHGMLVFDIELLNYTN
ncbi:MAG TPA: FKBP-type peptidyl-prolyl cis-trans isomerase [Gammaproteobacteria bacterium]|nr:FKBP-type peptidyl-prolyl cis-trans isomerase [Gammaproteobacteria bacterium]